MPSEALKIKAMNLMLLVSPNQGPLMLPTPPLPVANQQSPSMAEVFVNRPLHNLYPVDSAVAHQVAAFRRAFAEAVMLNHNHAQGGGDADTVDGVFTRVVRDHQILAIPLAAEHNREYGRPHLVDLTRYRVGRALDSLGTLFDKIVTNGNRLTPNDVNPLMASVYGDNDELLPKGLAVLSAAANYMLLSLLQVQVKHMLASDNAVLKSRGHVVTGFIAPYVTNDKILFSESVFIEMVFLLASTTVQDMSTWAKASAEEDTTVLHASLEPPKPGTTMAAE